MSIRQTGARVMEWFWATHLWRAYERYTYARGNVLAGGIAYYSFFAVAAVLTSLFSLFGVFLTGQPALLDQLVAYLDGLVPNVLATPANPDAPLDPQALLDRELLTFTGAVALGTALVAGVFWMGALRQGMRAVLGEPFDNRNVVRLFVHDMGVLVLLGAAVLASSLLMVTVSAAAEELLRLFGFSGDGWASTLLGAATFLTVAVADTAIFLLVLRWLPATKVPWRHLVSGAVFGGIGFAALKLLGGLLIGARGDNPLLRSAVVVVGLLVWMNLVGRLALLATAWTATSAAAREAAPQISIPAAQVPAAQGPAAPASAAAGDGRRGARTTEVAGGPREPQLPSFGKRAEDRTTLAAGLVLGATAALGLRAVGSAVAALGRGLTSSRD